MLTSYQRTAKDTARARALFDRACQDKDKLACENLDKMKKGGVEPYREP